MKLLLVLAVAPLGFVHSAHVAAEVRMSGCTSDSTRPSFQPTDANRLEGDRLVRTMVDRRITMLRVQDDGTADLRFVLLLRADGSFAQSCEFRSRRAAIREWERCVRLNVHGGGRDVGTWKLTDVKGEICYRRTGSENKGTADQCFTVHEDGGRRAIAATKNLRNCWPGDIEIGAPGG